MLIEKLMRGPLLQEAEEEGAAGGAAEEEQAVQPGPGETMDSVADLNAKPEEEAKEEATEEEAKEEEKEEAKADEPSIPKSRLDSALARAREAEAELRRLRTEQASAPAPEPKAAPAQDDDTISRSDAEKRVAELDIEIAAALRNEEMDDSDVAALIREQRELQEGIREVDAAQAQSTQRAMTQQEIQYNAVVVQLEEDVPVINPDSEKYDDDLAREVLTLAQALAQQGRTPSDALLLAVDYMSPKLGISQETAENVRKETNIERNTAVAEKMPPDVPGMQGTSSDKAGATGTAADVERMADAEFNALVDNDLERYKQLRGDFG